MSEKGVQVIDRAFDIIELLSFEKRGLGVTEIANRLGLNKSTVHRILTSIATRGYIEKTQEGLYTVGIRFIELSSNKLNNVELNTEARSYLWELANKIGQPTHLAVLEGSDAMYIDKVEIVSNIRLYSQIGKRIPVYCSGLGKSLLLQHSDDDILNILSQCNFIKNTDKTLINPEAVLEEIKRARQTGWTIDDEEHDQGIRCVAAPIYDYRKKIIAAISVAGPNNVIAPEKDNEIGKLVVEIALLISKRLGYQA